MSFQFLFTTFKRSSEKNPGVDRDSLSPQNYFSWVFFFFPCDPHPTLNLLWEPLDNLYLTDSAHVHASKCSLPHPDLQLYPLVVPVDGLDLEVDAHCADKGWRE